MVDIKLSQMDKSSEYRLNVVISRPKDVSISTIVMVSAVLAYCCSHVNVNLFEDGVKQ